MGLAADEHILLSHLEEINHLSAEVKDEVYSY